MPQSCFQSSVVPLGLIEDPLGGAPARGALAFTMQHQKQTQWCWAAVTASVAAYYRNQAWTQCRVVNNQLGQVSCCSNGSTSACNQPWYLDKALDVVGNLGDYAAGALSIGQITAEIDGARPIGVRI